MKYLNFSFSHFNKYSKLVFILLVYCFLFSSCISVEKYNKRLNDLHSAKEIKKDIDFVYRKLQLHPSLYWYISKKELDYKFDSLKATINCPMTSNEFFFKISPLIASVHQGHMAITPIIKKYPKKQLKTLNKSRGPISQFDYLCSEEKLLIIKNNSNFKNVKIGTEVLSINDIKPFDLIKKYQNTYTSDGYNQTYIAQTLARHVVNYYFYELGFKDSVKFDLKYNDTITSLWIKRKYDSPLIKTDSTTKNKSNVNRKEETIKKIINGFNKNTNQYSKELKILKPDSTVAIIKINDFVYGNFRKFYKQSFAKIDSLGIKTLIIDLRGNKGGRLNDIHNLYSYLVDTNFVFMQNSEIASRKSVFNVGYFGNSPIALKIFKGIFYPPFITVLLLKTEKSSEGKYYFNFKASKPSKHRNPNFKGKIYVLINGESFSASSILSSNLKGSKRAVFVGEETGGAYNGTVAGVMPSVKLPHTKLDFRFGLMAIKPFCQTEIEGRGIFPDIEIIPTLEERINGTDSEMNWILEDIKK
ncbi:MAG: S41 family peptidase [Bacteroidota bacterium]